MAVSAGQVPTPATHHLHALTPEEIKTASTVVRKEMSCEDLRFVAVSLQEPSKYEVSPLRMAEVVVLNPQSGIATELSVALDTEQITSRIDLPRGVQPMFTPEDCDLAEEIAKNSPELQHALLERYGITDMSRVAADPWSVHLADETDRSMTESGNPNDPPRRLVQTFLYQRMAGDGMEDNHYAHPIDIVPVVDLNTKSLVQIDGLDRPARKIPELSVNYHRDLLKTNSYLQTEWRHDALKALNITQPDGPSFDVTDTNLVKWQNWSFRVGFNYREGLVLHNVEFDGRTIMKRASLVEMAVPYGEPKAPYQRKCAFDVGDYGLGFCANSLELGCDCLGHIHYFDAYLNDIEGNPKVIKKAVCMHEEDDGLLWKHVEFRNGHNESRRSRELVISSIATVVNYEYLFYWRFKLDGSIHFEIRLTGELSTSLAEEGGPTHGVLVAPGVEAQVHQHMFCARLDMNVDGEKNTVSEVDVVREPLSDKNPYGNAFGATETILKTEHEAVRCADTTKARAWKISNATGKLNPFTKKPVAFKLIPFSMGASMPTLLTDPVSTVSSKGNFATANLWVTQYNEKERFPSGEYTVQAQVPDGLPKWIESNRSIEGEDIVLWHAFGVTHVPRVEDFPVMPCESTGFMLKPDGFFQGNPTINLAPESLASGKSKLSKGCCGEN
jgi:primary-amine oxidase